MSVLLQCAVCSTVCSTHAWWLLRGSHVSTPGVSHCMFCSTLLGMNPQNLSMGERFAIAEKMKAKGNELFKTKRYKYARARYERLLRMLDSTRDFERQEDVDKCVVQGRVGERVERGPWQRTA